MSAITLLLVLGLVAPPPAPPEWMPRAARVMMNLGLFERQAARNPRARLAVLNRTRVDLGLAPITLEQLQALADADIAADERDACEVARLTALEQGKLVEATQWAVERNAAEARRAAFAATAGIVVPGFFAP